MSGRGPLSEAERAARLEEQRRRKAERRTALLAHFPFKIVAVAGDIALETWEAMRAERHDCPVIVGGQEMLDALLENFDPAHPSCETVDAVLARAATIDISSALLTLRAQDYDVLDQLGSSPAPDVVWDALLTELQLPSTAWPDGADDEKGGLGLTIASDIRTGKPLDTVFILRIPTDDWTTIPAHLRYGGWNECPEPAQHVAAFRQWRDRYGAELVGLGSDTINMRVARPPQSRQAALALAREQFLYCFDIVVQGTQTLEALAAGLQKSRWWFFWWD